MTTLLSAMLGNTGEGPPGRLDLVAGLEAMPEEEKRLAMIDRIRRAVPTRREMCRALFPEKTAKVDQLVAEKRPFLFYPLSADQNWTRIGGEDAAFLIYGTMEDGRNATVALTQVPITFDVKVPSGQDPVDFSKRLVRALVGHSVKRCSHITLYPSDHFAVEQIPYVRLYFSSQFNRKKAIEKMDLPEFAAKLDTGPIMADGRPRPGWKGKYPLETSSDDTTLWLTVSRQYPFNQADWNVVSDWKMIAAPTETANPTFLCSIDNYKRAAWPAGGDLRPEPLLLTKGWDTEIHKEGNDGNAPTITDDFSIFMLSHAWTWSHESRPLALVAIAHPNIDADRRIALTVNTANDADLIFADAVITRLLAPNVLTGFNTNRFDWPMYLHRAEELNLVDVVYNCYSRRHWDRKEPCRLRSIKSAVFYSFQFKLDAETQLTLDYIARFPGSLDVDMYPLMRRLNSKDPNASLNYYLKNHQLDAKEDMPFLRMFRIYERARYIAARPSATCHCDRPEQRRDCELCRAVVREIDCVEQRTDDGTITWSDRCHPDADPAGPLCCCCGKAARNRRDMNDVAYYCAIDALRPHELQRKLNFLASAVNLANVSCTSTYSAMYKAATMRIVNLLGAEAHAQEVAFTTRYSDEPLEDKPWNQGAFVFKPRLGIERMRPIATNDFTSLYPNVILANNLSPEMKVRPEDEAALAARGYSFKNIGPMRVNYGLHNDPAKNRNESIQGKMVYHNNTWELGSDNRIVAKYGKIVTVRLAADAAPQEFGPAPADLAAAEALCGAAGMQRYTRIHRFVPQFGRPSLKRERLGVVPSVVFRLLDQRKAVNAMIAKMDLSLAPPGPAGKKAESADAYPWPDGMTEDEKRHQRKMADLLQYTLKILVNSIYGSLGKYTSPLYDVLCSGGTTWGGREVIHEVARIAKEICIKIRYGDTDSIMYKLAKKLLRYAEMPPGDATTEQILKARVELTDWYGKNVVEETIATQILEMTGSRFLVMLTERVAAPVCLSGKKKYCMRVYRGGAPQKNFLIKGYDVVKRNKALIVKNVGNWFFEQAMDPCSKAQPEDIVRNILVRLYGDHFDLDQYLYYETYRPTRNNVTMNTFVGRLAEISKTDAAQQDPVLREAYRVPQPGEKIGVVVCKHDARYTLTGANDKLLKGELLHPYEAVKYLEGRRGAPEVDPLHYIRSSIVGVLARFLTGETRYQAPQGKFPLDEIDDDSFEGNLQQRAADVYRSHKAKSYLLGVCDEFQNIAGLPNQIKERGKEYQRLYRDAKRRLVICGAAKFGKQRWNWHLIVAQFAHQNAKELAAADGKGAAADGAKLDLGKQLAQELGKCDKAATTKFIDRLTRDAPGAPHRGPPSAYWINANFESKRRLDVIYVALVNGVRVLLPRLTAWFDAFMHYILARRDDAEKMSDAERDAAAAAIVSATKTVGVVEILVRMWHGHMLMQKWREARYMAACDLEKTRIEARLGAARPPLLKN